MKLFLKKASTFLLSVVLIAGVILGNTTTVNAAAKPGFYGDSYQFMFCPEWDTFGLNVDNLTKKAKVTVSVDNKKIASVVWDKEQSVAWVSAKKTGTVNVKITVKQNGKTYKHTTKMKWVKYNNPLQSLQIGTTKYAAKYFNKNTQAEMKKVSGSKAVKVKLKSGYKLESIGFSRGGQYSNIKNGNKIKFSKVGKNNTVLFINYKDPKGNYGTLRLFVGDKNATLM